MWEKQISLAVFFLKLVQSIICFQYYCYLFKMHHENVISSCTSFRMTRRRYTVPPAWATTRWWSCCWSTRQTPTPPQQQDTLHCTSLLVRDTHRQPASYWTWTPSSPKWPRYSAAQSQDRLLIVLKLLKLSLETIMLFDWCHAERLHSPSCSSQIWKGGCSRAAFRERSQPKCCRKSMNQLHACMCLYVFIKCYSV